MAGTKAARAAASNLLPRPAAAPEPVRLTWDRWIPAFRPYLDDALVDEPALARLRATARRLPGDCLGALEVRLAPDAAAGRAPVDLSIRLDRPAQAHELARRAATPALSALLARWISGEIPHRAVPALWLEYDLDRGRPPVPLPCARLAGGLDPEWLVDRLLPALRGAPPPPAQRGLVRRCLDALPPGVRPLYLFDLRPRATDAVRLELYGTEPAALVDYLGRVAAASAARRVARLVPLVASCERFHLSLDLGAAVAPRIGFEAAFRRPPEREPRWRELCDRLVAGRLCSRRRGAAVLRWPGYDSLWTAARRWPGGGRAGGRRPGGYAVRCLSHVKLVSSAAGTEAKAYLLFQHLRGRAVKPGPGSR